MLKAKSAECRQQTPLNDGEKYHIKYKGWNDEETLVVLKDQQAQLPDRLISAINEIGEILYPKGRKWTLKR
jgi:hypothetical protein